MTSKIIFVLLSTIVFGCANEKFVPSTEDPTPRTVSSHTSNKSFKLNIALNECALNNMANVDDGISGAHLVAKQLCNKCAVENYALAKAIAEEQATVGAYNRHLLYFGNPLVNMERFTSLVMEIRANNRKYQNRVIE